MTITGTRVATLVLELGAKHIPKARTSYTVINFL